MKKVAILLAGCGVLDGSEIREAVLIFYMLDKLDIAFQCLAPDVWQERVVNHYTHQKIQDQRRNVLEESARLARGNIENIRDVSVTDFDAVIIPGGSGVVNNLSDFESSRISSALEIHVYEFLTAMASARRPSGFMGTAAAIVPLIYGKAVQITLGMDRESAHTAEILGSQHLSCKVDNIVIDERYKVVTTPAHSSMLTLRLKDVAGGIEKLVGKIVEWM